MKNIVVKDGMTYDVNGNLVMNITPAEWEAALQENRVIVNCTKVSSSGTSATFKVYIMSQGDNGRYYLKHVYGKGYDNRRDGFVVKGCGVNRYVELIETISRELGLDNDTILKYQSNFNRM